MVSASPLLPQKRQNNNFKECMDRNGKRYFLYNKKGVPGPNDLKVATERERPEEQVSAMRHQLNPLHSR